jgi:catechol O-methyltransferase
MAYESTAIVHTIEPNEEYAGIAHRIHQHAGLADRIIIHIGTVQSQADFIKSHGKFDFIFIDHLKDLYLKDFNELEGFGVIGKGTVIVADNIIYPGSPSYLKYFQENNQYDSILYHSYLEYTNQPDAVLMSERIVE